VNHHNSIERADNRYFFDFVDPPASPVFELFAVGMHFSLRGLMEPYQDGSGFGGVKVSEDERDYAIPVGSELFHTYGSRTNAHLFSSYNFVLPQSYDYVIDYVPNACCIHRSIVEALFEEIYLQSIVFQEWDPPIDCIVV
jgi:hypothetical protein